MKNLWQWVHVTNQLLNRKWIDHLSGFRQLIVGFSGGLDSTVLLHVLVSQSSLVPKILAVHVNHGISQNSSLWQDHCAQVCSQLGVNFLAQSVDFDKTANLEERARTARFNVFSKLLSEKDCLILGHHQDDQAETVLLQLFRGAGVDGLAAMTELSSIGGGTVARPFLFFSREQLKHYAIEHQLKWIEDESNEDCKYSRNFLRQQMIPLLQSKWPGVVGNIARTAIHCQHAKSNLEELAIQDCPQLAKSPSALLIEPFLSHTFERIINILRVWLKTNNIKLPSTATLNRLIKEVILARPDAMPQVNWGDVQVRRYNGYLYLDKQRTFELPHRIDWIDFPNDLEWGEQTVILSARQSNQGLRVPEGATIQVKFRQGGETFYWRGHTKQLKKLFQEWCVPPWHRDSIPLIYINDQLAAVIGYAVSDFFFTTDATHAWDLTFR